MVVLILSSYAQPLWKIYRRTGSAQTIQGHGFSDFNCLVTTLLDTGMRYRVLEHAEPRTTTKALICTLADGKAVIGSRQETMGFGLLQAISSHDSASYTTAALNI